MRLNPDLVRELMLKLEAGLDGPGKQWRTHAGKEWEEYYTLAKLAEAGFIRNGSTNLYNASENIMYVYEITYQGHQFIESIRDEEVWKETKKQALKLGSFSLDVLKGLASGYVKTKLKKMTGVEFE